MHHQVCTNCLTCFEGIAPEPLLTTKKQKRDNNSLENIHGIHLMRDWYLLSMSEEYDKAENENVQKSLKLHRSENIVVAGTLLSLIDLSTTHNCTPTLFHHKITIRQFDWIL